MLTDIEPLVLGSASPRRRDMLVQLSIPFVTLPPLVDETPLGGEKSEDYVRRITQLKLAAVLGSLESAPVPHGGVLVADTVVILDHQILGKPKNRDDSLAMVRALCGRTHSVLTSYALSVRNSGKTAARVVATEVRMRPASDAELQAYVSTGEGDDKAGAYAIQGRAAFLIESISGSYSNVVGLPLCELVLDMKGLGLLGHAS